MTSKPAVTRRKRQSGVRGRILELLAAGSLAAQDLVDQGGFSPASLYLNLKALKAEGSVDTHRDGRVVRYQLSGRLDDNAVAATSGKPVKAGRGRPSGTSRGVEPALAGTAELKAALGVLLTRLSPLEDADEKIMVLSQLAGSMPVPVARVLRAVVDDLGRLRGKA